MAPVSRSLLSVATGYVLLYTEISGMSERRRAMATRARASDASRGVHGCYARRDLSPSSDELSDDAFDPFVSDDLLDPNALSAEQDDWDLSEACRRLGVGRFVPQPVGTSLRSQVTG
jgi:hypothetical protein